MSGFISNHNTVWEYPRPYMVTHVNVLGMSMDQKLPKIPGMNCIKIGHRKTDSQ